MTTPPSNKTRTAYVDEVIVPGGQTAREQMRCLGDLPAALSPGAREVSIVTAVCRAREKALPIVHAALAKLAALPASAWDGQWLSRLPNVLRQVSRPEFAVRHA